MMGDTKEEINRKIQKKINWKKCWVEKNIEI